MRPSPQQLASALVDAPPRVIDLALAIGRLVKGYSNVEVLAALSDVIAWIVAQGLQDEAAIGPVIELWARRTTERAAIIHSASEAAAAPAPEAS